MEQDIRWASEGYAKLDEWVRGHHRILLVCGASIASLRVHGYFEALPDRTGVSIVRFSDFQPNPLYESVVKGVELFRRESCDAIIAVGGGSAMDVAKCIKLYSTLKGDGRDGAFLQQTVTANAVPFLAIPTTAGTGSEATRFAVVYYDGDKQSVAHDSCIPQVVLMDSSALETLPLYQKKSTMMDALCHAIEAFWSVNSTPLSRSFSQEAIRAVLKHMDGYLANTKEGNRGMILAAHTAGKAINIAQTTAGHAMCYKITSLFGVSHGHAAILCDRVLYPWMIDALREGRAHCIDPRGERYVQEILLQIAQAMGCGSMEEGAERLDRIFSDLGLEVPIATAGQFDRLKASVNPVRLKNHPISLEEGMIDLLYHRILRESDAGQV